MSENISNLLEQMKPKRDPDEIDFNKKLTEEKHKSKDIEFDYYKILGIESTATHIEIKRAYQSKLKKLHPDKIEQTKENKAKYKLIREAGDLLSDQNERKAYDMQRKMESTQKDFKLQKESFKDFMKLQEQNMTEEDKTIAKLSFERGLTDMDRKHGYNKNESDVISRDEHVRRMDDLKLQREQDEIELSHENIFKGRNFNSNEFNKIFEKKKKRNDKKTSITKYDNNISAFNDFEDDSGGVGIENYDKLYSEGTFIDYNDKYASIGAGSIDDKNDQSDEISIDSPDEGIATENIDSALKKMMSERSDQNTFFDKMDNNEFGSALNDKYGISSQLGFMVGNDKFGQQKDIKKRNVQEETMKVYKKLTEK